MTRVSGAWLEAEGTQQVLSMLEASGAQALLVGGCVRNALLDQPVKDIDIATDARPEKVMQLAVAAGLRAIATGIDHGTVTVLAGGEPHEVTTFRRDIETDGRHAVVHFSDHVEEDAARRDFTMNALYARKDGSIVDPLGGLDDLQRRYVRFIGDPSARIVEDYLRSLRYFRFHALYGDPELGLDASALDGIARNLDGVNALSRERVGAEMLKLLAAPDPASAVATMRSVGVLPLCLPGADDTALAPLVHLENTVGTAPDAIRRLSVLGGAAPATALRLSRAQQKQLSILQDGTGSMQGPSELAYRHNAHLARDIVLLRSALMGTEIPSDLDDLIALGSQAVFPLKASDLMPDYKGPALGKRLRELEAIWIASNFSMDRSALTAL